MNRLQHFAAQHREIESLVGRHRHQEPVDVVDRRDQPAGERDDDVARLDAGLVGEAAARDFADFDALIGRADRARAPAPAATA